MNPSLSIKTCGGALASHNRLRWDMGGVEIESDFRLPSPVVSSNDARGKAA